MQKIKDVFVDTILFSMRQITVLLGLGGVMLVGSLVFGSANLSAFANANLQATPPSTLTEPLKTIGQSCGACHFSEQVVALIAEREVAVDFASLPVPEFALIEALGGEGSNRLSHLSSDAYAQFISHLTPAELALHLQGDKLFESNFVTNSKTLPTVGLGPVYNDNNCNGCHPKDGRAGLKWSSDRKPQKLADSGTFLRLSIENDNTYQGRSGGIPASATNEWGGPTAVPGFGTQLFQRASVYQTELRPSFTKENGEVDWTASISGQADVWLTIAEHHEAYADGSEVVLKRPQLLIDNPYDAPDDSAIFNDYRTGHPSPSRLFAPDVKTSMRIAPPIFGLGLLEAIADADLLALENRDITQQAGITGRANRVFSPLKWQVCQSVNNCEANPPVALGRFGWKASKASVRAQSLGALQGDMGVTNTLFPQESIANTPLYDQLLVRKPSLAKNRTQIESNAQLDDALVFYAQTLAVPARDIRSRSVEEKENLIKGAKLLVAANCVACHTPKFKTAEQHPIAALRNQVIYPFSDLLLHDMGEGLADHRQDFEANGREWQTRPLWGIGKNQKVNPAAGYLHDGRAQTLEEAILWHGGEAASSQAFFRQLSKENRDYLLGFLRSL